MGAPAHVRLRRRLGLQRQHHHNQILQHHQSLAYRSRTLILAHQPLATPEQHAHACRLAAPRQRHRRTGLANGLFFGSMRRHRTSRRSASQRGLGRGSRRRRLHVSRRILRLSPFIPPRYDRKARIRMPSCISEDHRWFSSNCKGHSIPQRPEPPQAQEFRREEFGRMRVFHVVENRPLFFF